jgi:gluconolactonase
MLYPPPATIEAEVWTTMPAEFRRADAAPPWAAANRAGQPCDSFLEGPGFDRDGNLWLVDIPYGRVFRVSPEGDWSLVAEYDGWPNGLKIHPDGRVLIADYAHGIMELDPVSGRVAPLLTHRHSEHFRGCNDLFLAQDGTLWFTDQGQSGLHRPDGRVFRWDFATRLDLLLETGPSPNGLVMTLDEAQMLVAMTRDNAVWRLPIMPDGAVSKVGRFVQLSGGLAGPDGMALDAEGGLWVADAGHGCVWGFSALGVPRWRVTAPQGLSCTNLAFHPDRAEIYATLSDLGEVLRATVPVKGKRMASHG